MRQAARDARVEERRLELVADLVLPVEQSDLAQTEGVFAAVADDVAHEPRDLLIFRVEVKHVDAERRRPIGLRYLAVLEDRRVELDEPAGEIEDVARTAAILARGRPDSLCRSR